MGYDNQYRNDKQSAIRETMNQWALYFRRKINEEMVNIYRKRMAPYSVKSIRAVGEHFIENGDRFPKVYEVKYQLQATEILADQIQYDREEDLRFPVHHMLWAFKILTEKGREAFVAYCDKTRMPLTDRERVINKANYAFRDEPSVLSIIDGVADQFDAGNNQRGIHTHPHHQQEIGR